MRYSANRFRSLAACGLTAAALLIWGAAAHAQGARGATGGGSSGMGSSGFGGGGGLGSGGGLGGGSTGFGGGSTGFGNNSSGQFSFSGGSANSFVGSSGGSSSFVGSSGGSSFTGGSGGTFTGSSGTGGLGSGTFGGGGYGGGRGFGAGASYSGVSNMNFLASNFSNPLAQGLASGSSVAFGQPLYSNLNPTSTNLLGGSSSGLGGTARLGGGLGGGGGLSSTSGGQTGGSYGALGIANRNSVVVSLPPGTLPAGPGAVSSVNPAGPVANPAVQLSALPARMQTDLQSLISRSDLSPATKSAVTFGLDGSGTLVLRGNAGNAADARTIETLLRFAPGVRAVRNEMTWK
jgi:hypothetical protein